MTTAMKIAAVLTLATVGLAACAQTETKKVDATPGTPAAVKAPAAVAESKVVANYGAAINRTDVETVAVDKVLASPETYNGKVMRITGKVGQVCQEKGCWMTVVAPETKKYIFIKFQDPPEGRLIPLTAPEHEVLLEGTFTIAQMKEASARHFAEGMGATDEELQKIVGPQTAYIVRNVGVRIYDLDPAAAATQPVKQEGH